MHRACAYARGLAQLTSRERCCGFGQDCDPLRCGGLRPLRGLDSLFSTTLSARAGALEMRARQMISTGRGAMFVREIQGLVEAAPIEIGIAPGVQL